ncbi:MAG TPA: hypothetical protein VHL98_00580 [Microvirga sp.]|jgi:hypothetical protein|nr:hypothetical protein [Microvirga sp.]
MKKTTFALVALTALSGLAASVQPAEAWHRRWHRPVVVAPFYAAPVYVAPRVVYRAPARVVYRAPVRRKRVVIYR